MKRIGTVSYNIYCNFTNYGSALQTWALHQIIKKIGYGNYEPILVDYCPDTLLNKNPLNPMANMWDKDKESQLMCELSMPAIRENFEKFERFYIEQFNRTAIKYTSHNFNDVIENEKIDGFICGSDTIFCIDEFNGFDDGYYANYPCMKNGYSVAYAASFGDSHFTAETYNMLNNRLQNFKYIGLREETMLDYVKQHTKIPVEQVIDPTLLLTSNDYNCITAPKQETEKYLLLYIRRYNPEIETYAENIAAKNGWKIVEISLRAINEKKPNRRMFYNAGVEEFLSLVKYAEFVVTNSFHGAIFSVQYRRPFYVFFREQCDAKITQLLKLFGMSGQVSITKDEDIKMKYESIHSRINLARNKSLDFLKKELLACPDVKKYYCRKKDKIFNERFSK